LDKELGRAHLQDDSGVRGEGTAAGRHPHPNRRGTSNGLRGGFSTFAELDIKKINIFS
jgi:hypothetical protein